LPRRLTVLARESMEEAAQNGRAAVGVDDVEAAAANVIGKADGAAQPPAPAVEHSRPGHVMPWWMFWKRAS
jgi:hypothetical protein